MKMKIRKELLMRKWPLKKTKTWVKVLSKKYKKSKCKIKNRIDTSRSSEFCEIVENNLANESADFIVDDSSDSSSASSSNYELPYLFQDEDMANILNKEEIKPIVPEDKDIEEAMVDETEIALANKHSETESNLWFHEDTCHRSVLTIIKSPEEISFSGIAEIKVLFGEINIAGYPLTAFQPWKTLYSSATFNCLTFVLSTRTVARDFDLELVQLHKHLQSLYSPDICQEVMDNVSRDSVVLILKSDFPSALKFPLKFTKNIFSPKLVSQDLSFSKASFKKQSFKLHHFDRDHSLIFPAKYYQMADVILHQTFYMNSKYLQAPRIIVCGSRNAGKSTLIRFITNYLLQRIPEVIHLEGDPGQTEFTPPGCLSVTKISSPLFGPPFTHMRTPEKMIWVGGMNVQNYPDQYSSAILDLIDFCKVQYQTSPVIVNTMGWTTSLGLSLLIDAIRTLQPTHIIQFKDTRNTKFALPYLSREFLKSACGWCSSQDCHLPEYEIAVIDPVFSKVDEVNKISAPEKRDLTILTYLGKSALSGLPAPYQILWSSIGIYLGKDAIPPDQILYVLNVCWVALCKVDSSLLVETHVDKDGSPLRILSSCPPNECLGFGLIRAVSIQKKMLYIVTTEPLNRVQQVNAILCGDVKVPASLLYNQQIGLKSDVVQIPYLMQTDKKRTKRMKGLAQEVKDRVWRKKKRNL